jgi:hypothetical protein
MWFNVGAQGRSTGKSAIVSYSLVSSGQHVDKFAAMASKLLCDETHWPLVLLQAPLQWGMDSVVRYTELTARLLRDTSHFGLVFDLRDSTMAPPHLRGRLAAHRRWLFQQSGERLIIECVVVGSRLQREGFAVPWESVPGATAGVHPAQQFFSDADSALDFALAKMAESATSRSPVPPRPSGVVWKPLRKAGDPGAEQFTLARKRSS